MVFLCLFKACHLRTEVGSRLPLVIPWDPRLDNWATLWLFGKLKDGVSVGRYMTFLLIHIIYIQIYTYIYIYLHTYIHTYIYYIYYIYIYGIYIFIYTYFCIISIVSPRPTWSWGTCWSSYSTPSGRSHRCSVSDFTRKMGKWCDVFGKP